MPLAELATEADLLEGLVAEMGQQTCSPMAAKKLHYQLNILHRTDRPRSWQLVTAGQYGLRRARNARFSPHQGAKGAGTRGRQ